MSSGPAFEVRGAQKAAVDLRALGDRGSDIRRVSEKVRTIYRKSNERRFGGAFWPPLADSTKERKAREGLDPRPLRGATGALYRSLTSARASDQVDQRDKTVFKFGTRVPYAHFQLGTSRQPRRDLIQLTISETSEIKRLVSAYIARSEA